MLDRPVPDFELPRPGQAIPLIHAKGKPLVLYFYPKTPLPHVLPKLNSFRDLHPDFQALGCQIYGISRDS